MRDEDFQSLLTGAREIDEYRRGARSDLRITVLPTPPKPMEPAEVQALRERIGVSQRVFAMTLNVSIKTVQAWESGARVADGGNLRLLRLAERHPQVVFEWMQEPKPAPAPAKKARRARRAKPQPA
jgi:DNA-binding transcriptional regulator YiaG